MLGNHQNDIHHRLVFNKGPAKRRVYPDPGREQETKAKGKNSAKLDHQTCYENFVEDDNNF